MRNLESVAQEMAELLHNTSSIKVKNLILSLHILYYQHLGTVENRNCDLAAQRFYTVNSISTTCSIVLLLCIEAK